MSIVAEQVETFFKEYIYGFIFTDIEREITLAKTGQGGGNFLSALGLLCYTEFMGGLKNGRFVQGLSRRNFDAFFRDLGAPYRALMDGGTDVFKLFRCGMVHEYFVKGNCVVYMLGEEATCGVGTHITGSRYFVVERYFRDFSDACHRLESDLASRAHFAIPRTFPVPDPSRAGPSFTRLLPGNPVRFQP